MHIESKGWLARDGIYSNSGWKYNNDDSTILSNQEQLVTEDTKVASHYTLSRNINGGLNYKNAKNVFGKLWPIKDPTDNLTVSIGGPVPPELGLTPSDFADNNDYFIYKYRHDVHDQLGWISSTSKADNEPSYKTKTTDDYGIVVKNSQNKLVIIFKWSERVAEPKS
ncbi:MAG: hypothetical protein NC236_02385 [Mycoplasma sp.]|nr:hypothetical protein [Mycoplasma sp.]